MGTLIKLAWRNIWRNKRRTIILICAMSTGLIGILVCEGFINGWLDSMIENATNKGTGHIAIFAKGYFENPAVEKNLAIDADLEKSLDADPRIKQWTPRIKVNGLLSNAEHANMINIIGVAPDREANVSVIADSMVEGRWLKPDDRNVIVIGAKTAERYGTKLGRKVVLISQQDGGDVGSAAFHIVGIFRTDAEAFDKSVVYINLPDARKLVNLIDRITEVNLVLNDLNQVDDVSASLGTKLDTGKLEVLTWKDQQPFTVKMIGMSDAWTGIVYAIYFIAMAFGIVNTLLMAVNERYREIGIMLAIGTRRFQVVVMVALESFFLAVISVIVGNAIGIGLVRYWGATGMDLSSFAEGLAMYGMGRVLYLSIGVDSVIQMSVITFVIAVLFSLYPAIRASRFKPIEAIQRL